MISELSQGFSALCLLAFVLGMKHGLDPDHLATIDGLTRYNAVGRPSLARRCGMLFSLGHGSVVMFIALSVSLLTERWVAPDWLEVTGLWISIGFLGALGWMNLHAALLTPKGEVVKIAGLKGKLLGQLSRSDRPGLIALVGALFALSFDTISQAALFAVAGSQFGGPHHAIILGLLFTFGMLATDGLNGLFFYGLINRADKNSINASRIIASSVGIISLAIASLGIAKFLSPQVNQWLDGKEMMLGVGITLTMMVTILGLPAMMRWRTAVRS